MSELEGIVLGFDPGGKTKRAFGWSVCQTDGNALLPRPKTGSTIHAEEAIRQVQSAMKSHSNLKVLAAGIDAPLLWSREGDRKIDGIIRKELEKNGYSTGTVISVNSLRGACLAQGLLLAIRLNEIYKPQITEAHPTALLRLLKKLGQDGEINNLIKGLTGHKRDATISAYAAWAMIKKFPDWRDIYQDEHDSVRPFNTPVSYWMPIPKHPYADEARR